MSKSTPRTVLEMFGVTLDALNVIEQHTHLRSVAGESLDVIRVIVKRLRDGFDGQATPETVNSELKILSQMLKANDVAADSAIDAKFKGEF